MEKQIEFLSDGYQLKGFLHLPETESPPVVIGSHGLFANCQSPKQIGLAQKCNDAGIAFFRFDHKGIGQSQGNFEDVTSLDFRVQDLENAAQTILNSGLVSQKLALFGSSMGGATCVEFIKRNKFKVLGAVLYSAPLKSGPVSAAVAKSPEADFLSERFFKEAIHFDISDGLEKLSNILIVHGNNDEVVPLENAYKIHENANPPKKLIIQEGGDHPMSNPEHQEAFIIEASKWLIDCLQ